MKTTTIFSLFFLSYSYLTLCGPVTATACYAGCILCSVPAGHWAPTIYVYCAHVCAAYAVGCFDKNASLFSS